jgi:hypothetical protein
MYCLRKLYQLYVVYDPEGRYRAGVDDRRGKEVKGAGRPLVACEKHSEDEIGRAVQNVYGEQTRMRSEEQTGIELSK